jgi:hypothetical protein
MRTGKNRVGSESDRKEGFIVVRCFAIHAGHRRKPIAEVGKGRSSGDYQVVSRGSGGKRIGLGGGVADIEIGRRGRKNADVRLMHHILQLANGSVMEIGAIDRIGGAGPGQRQRDGIGPGAASGKLVNEALALRRRRGCCFP